MNIFFVILKDAQVLIQNLVRPINSFSHQSIKIFRYTIDVIDMIVIMSFFNAFNFNNFIHCVNKIFQLINRVPWA